MALGRDFGYDPFILSSFGGMVRALRSGAQRRCLSGEDETWRPIYPVPLGLGWVERAKACDVRLLVRYGASDSSLFQLHLP